MNKLISECKAHSGPIGHTSTELNRQLGSLDSHDHALFLFALSNGAVEIKFTSHQFRHFDDTLDSVFGPRLHSNVFRTNT